MLSNANGLNVQNVHHDETGLFGSCISPTVSDQWYQEMWSGESERPGRWIRFRSPFFWTPFETQ